MEKLTLTAVNRMNVGALRDQLLARALPTDGNKKDLVQRLRNWVLESDQRAQNVKPVAFGGMAIPPFQQQEQKATVVAQVAAAAIEKEGITAAIDSSKEKSGYILGQEQQISENLLASDIEKEGKKIGDNGHELAEEEAKVASFENDSIGEKKESEDAAAGERIGDEDVSMTHTVDTTDVDHAKENPQDISHMEGAINADPDDDNEPEAPEEPEEADEEKLAGVDESIMSDSNQSKKLIENEVIMEESETEPNHTGVSVLLEKEAQESPALPSEDVVETDEQMEPRKELVANDASEHKNIRSSNEETVQNADSEAVASTSEQNVTSTKADDSARNRRERPSSEAEEESMGRRRDKAHPQRNVKISLVKITQRTKLAKDASQDERNTKSEPLRGDGGESKHAHENRDGDFDVGIKRQRSGRLFQALGDIKRGKVMEPVCGAKNTAKLVENDDAPRAKEIETRALRIDNFVRPFTDLALKSLLESGGMPVNLLRLDSKKTHCFVVFSTVEEAKWVRNAVFNFKWPLPHGTHLRPKFVSLEEAEGLDKSEEPPTTSPGQREEADQPLSLDDIFMKTKAEPPLYYLPLTEELAEARIKRKAEIKAKRDAEIADRNRKRALESQVDRTRVPYRRPAAQDRPGMDRSRERRAFRAYRR